MMKLRLIPILLLLLPTVLCAQQTRQSDQSAKAAQMLKTAEQVMAQVEELRGWKFKRPVDKDIKDVEQLRAYIEKQLDSLSWE